MPQEGSLLKFFFVINIATVDGLDFLEISYKLLLLAITIVQYEGIPMVKLPSMISVASMSASGRPQEGCLGGGLSGGP